jgi:hypothetical protein
LHESIYHTVNKALLFIEVHHQLKLGNNNFQCEKKFGNRRNLLSHMRRHTGDFKLFCADCGKGFFTQSKLESHKRKHTGWQQGMPLVKEA